MNPLLRLLIAFAILAAGLLPMLDGVAHHAMAAMEHDGALHHRDQTASPDVHGKERAGHAPKSTLPDGLHCALCLTVQPQLPALPTRGLTHLAPLPAACPSLLVRFPSPLEKPPCAVAI